MLWAHIKTQQNLGYILQWPRFPLLQKHFSSQGSGGVIPRIQWNLFQNLTDSSIWLLIKMLPSPVVEPHWNQV